MSGAQPLGVGLVGCGVISRTHAQALAELARRGIARLVAVMDTDPDRSQALAQTAGVRAYTDLGAFLRHPGLEAVFVLTPSGLHATIGVEAAQAGKHVLVEKPIDVSLAAADRLIAACDRAGVALGVVSQYRFLPGAQALKRALDEGRFGPLVLGSAHGKYYRTAEYYRSGSWRATWELDGGGALINQTVHMIDLLLWYLGEVEELYGFTATRAHDIPVEDVGVACLRFRSGALGLIEGSTAEYPGFFSRIEVHGARASAVLIDGRLERWEEEGGAPPPEAPGAEVAGAPGPHLRQIEDFCLAARTGRRPLVDGWEGRRALEVILAIYRASRTGQPVRLA